MTVHAVGHAADDGILIGLFGQLGHQLADSDSIHIGSDRFVQRPAIIRARLGLRVPGIQVRRTAPHPDLDDGFGFACRRGGRRQGPQTEVVAEHQPSRAEQGALDRLAPGDRRAGHAKNLFVRPGVERYAV